jgi:hypothetical protein
MVQLNKVDQNFGIEKFLNALRLEVAAEASGQRGAQSDPDNYGTTTDFRLEVISGVEDHQTIPVIISHCLVMPTQRGKEFLKVLTRSEYPQLPRILRVLDGMQLNILCDELFFWAAACGDLTIALRAASLVVMSDFVRPWYWNTIMRTLVIVISIIADEAESETPYTAGHQESIVRIINTFIVIGAPPSKPPLQILVN